MPFDFKKEYKEFYLPKNKPQIVNVPKANYIAIRGQGNPNEEGGAYKQAIGILYAALSSSTGRAFQGSAIASLFCRQNNEAPN